MSSPHEAAFLTLVVGIARGDKVVGLNGRGVIRGVLLGATKKARREIRKTAELVLDVLDELG